ncbi:TraM recognition domain-containing protein [Sulfurimonas sp.]|uniref:type IV secretory system conjugative DNA transfer family protein n=1 Tax=Sulfurimonas sp. TaxID=2022749 RepID=UPI0025CD4484|nr:TraM recognition domain-containing protein [Sulfurimonas sp.]
MLFKKKRKPIKKADENFKELMYWKREFKKINNELDKVKNEISEHSETEIVQRKIHIEKKLDAAERNMYNISEGMYFGVGFELNNTNTPEPKPIIAKWGKLDNHCGFKGSTRVGKTINMQGHIEQCVAKNMDVIVIDPKGGVNQEVLSSVVESCFKYKRAEELTYFSPAFASISQRINVCYGLSNLELTGGIVESIKTPTMDSFYLETAEEILMAITSSFEYLQEISDPTGKITKMLEQKELKRYHAFLNSKNKEEYDFLENIDLDNIDMIEEFKSNVIDEALLLEFQENGFNRSLITFRELEYYAHYKTLRSLKTLVETVEIEREVKYRKNIAALRRDALVLLKSALSTEETHFAKVSKTLTNRLTALSVGPIGELLCGIRINPLMNRLLREDKGIVSVIQPFPMKFKKSADIFNKMLLGMLDSMMGAVGAEGRGLPRRVAIFIDEAGAIAYPGIESFFNRAGGLGISVFVYTQTDEDYKEAVGETLSSIILDNVNSKGIMRQNTLLSLRNAAEEIGTFKQMKTIAMVSAGGSGSEGRYTTDISEEFMCSPQDIKALPVGEGIFMHDGKTFYMEFPFRTPPAASIKMPKLSEEVEKRELASYEKILEDNERELAS